MSIADGAILSDVLSVEVDANAACVKISITKVSPPSPKVPGSRRPGHYLAAIFEDSSPPPKAALAIVHVILNG